MIFLRLIPVILSFLILGAHFSRDNMSSLMMISLAFPFLLLIKKPWVPKVFQIALILGTLEWLRSLYFYIQAYEQSGQSWTKLLVIIGSVTLFTALSVLVFNNKAIRKRYI
ncbi:MAG: hypothetical protein J7K39_09280 [Bacteroidales bacterium]|nr:hypothetical protein [Bacteroidales bacterium]